MSRDAEKGFTEFEMWLDAEYQARHISEDDYEKYMTMYKEIVEKNRSEYAHYNKICP